MILAMARARKPNRPSPLTALFRALADDTRLRLLNLIADRELCVCYFVQILSLSQPKISRHLAYLRRAGIVASRREGKWMHYRLALPHDPASAAILKEALAHLRDRPDLRADVAKLDAGCCDPSVLHVPERAPQPAVPSAG
jgi:ArsR family transcriptional regulator